MNNSTPDLVALNDFLNRLTDELRTHGSDAQSVKDLLHQAEQNAAWKAPAEAAVHLRRAYEKAYESKPCKSGWNPWKKNG